MDKTTEVYNFEHANVHSDAGTGIKITCPNCQETIIFASHAWWDTSCSCGTWELKAVLEVNV